MIGINDFDVSVCCLSFSKADGGSYLVAVDEAPEHIISIWDWQRGENGYKVTETKVYYKFFWKYQQKLIIGF